jgi:hypothetical protein
MPGRGSICAFAQLQFRWQPFTLNAFPSAKYLLLQNAAELYATVQELSGKPDEPRWENRRYWFAAR